ncbi:UROD/MetE-like protein [Laetiporus sulphureus 93-53]|uniref:UROD/MetE-like protein n=1 Tax=Laetiporus sulphureus 93-53 TaxID=1314785 RepID=A0A165IMR3_9APHY|nr:UROD/MetE-like protein [Laetiporus sulphureus 93-53]KZT13295.1 UROD/MetE-like protein [Laetiporus sulphureus 93-53]
MAIDSPRLRPPFRAEQIGSLKRPTALLRKREAFEEGKCTQEQLREVEDEAISGILQMQRQVGIKAMTDGEFRRHMFFDGVFDNLEGMKYIPVVPDEWFMEYVPDIDGFKALKGGATYICESKIKRTKPFYVGQFENLKRLTAQEEYGHIKLTICAPGWYHLRHGPYAYPKDVYANDEEYFADIIEAYREELKDLYAIGCRNIQFDDPLLAYFCDMNMLKGMKEHDIDPEALFNLYCRVYRDILEEKPADMTVGIHLCRGNFKDGHHFSQGGYDRIAIKLFQEIPCDTYYLEYETERAGTFEPLRWLPRNKSVVLGLISSKFPKMEDKEELILRVHQAAEIISGGEEKRPKEEALNQICISPQCGFASHELGNPVTEEDMIRKLRLIVDTAKVIWSDA